MDPTEAIRALGKENAIFHFHAKDTKIDKYNTAVNGVLDCKHYGDEMNRSWVFRSLGYGNDYSMWKEMVSMLQLVGYNHVMSIEHEDSYMTINEGLEKAVSFLRSVIISEPKPNGMFWA
jgi:sugar phosphate isomerase/epimerase